MTEIHYEVVQHDGGWAYRLDGAFSETFQTREAAHDAAARAAAEQAQPGETEAIAYQDADGKWHEEVAPGSDRPAADVTDEP